MHPDSLKKLRERNTGTTHAKDHKARHQDGGLDEISIAGLSGLAGDQQTPLDHDHSGDTGDGGQDIMLIVIMSGV